MTKNITCLTLTLTLILNQSFGQHFKQQFNELVSAKDTSGQLQVLEKWEKSDPNDPELYVAYFNYFVQKSRREIVKLDNNPNKNESLRIMDKDSTKKEPVAYIYGETYYDPELLAIGFNYINKGSEKHPNRLDMRFGKIYMYGEDKDYENFTTEIIKTIDHSSINKNKWTWTDNKPVEDPIAFMLGSIQT
jgi:hypothetical protein